MKLVTLTRDMRPHHAGADVLVPEEMSNRLVASGEAKNPREWPPRGDPAPVKPAPATPARRYKTK